MDDSYNEQTKISSITGLLVSVKMYAETRTKFYKIVPREEHTLPGGKIIVDIRPPELRGSEYLKSLPNVDDDIKIKTFEDVAELVITRNLEVYRSGLYINQRTMKISKDFNINWRFLDLCWSRMILMLEPKLVNEMIVPVMDGFKDFKIFSQIVKNMDLMRSAGWEPIMSVKNTENILGEVFYCDSKFSIFTQIADNVEYLRQVTDLVREGIELSEFKRRLLPISERLTPSIIREEIYRMKIDDREQE